MTVAEESARTDAPAGGMPMVSFGEALRVWLKIGLLGFGGPAGQIALMHKILVDEKRWIDETRFLHALNYCMLLPGPEAQQLATYVGWLLHGTKGGLAAGLLFIIPGAFVVLALSIAYVALVDLPLVQGLFLGIKAAVLALVIEALIKIAKRVLKHRAAFWIAGAAFLSIFALHIPFPLIIAGAAAFGFAAHRWKIKGFGDKAPEAVQAQSGERPSLGRTLGTAAFGLSAWLVPVALLWVGLGPAHVYTALAVFFSKVAVVTFGGAYAVLAYVGQEAVASYNWLAPGEMLDGLGLAETTPGPLILVLEFVGFVAGFRHAPGLPPYLAGTLGALITLWVTFAPCFLWIFLGAPYVETLRANRALSAGLTAVTAAVVGVVLNLTLWFALHLVFDESTNVDAGPFGLLLPRLSSIQPAALVLSAIACAALFRLRFGTLGTLALAGGLGMAWSLWQGGPA